MTQKLLLVADDQEDNRLILSAILTHYQYGVFLAANGVEAVEQARQHLPDLILMDLQMPVMDGWEAARRLRSLPETAHIGLIAVTAEDHDRQSLEHAGFCAYIRKPFAPRAAVQAVEQCLKHTGPHRWVDLSRVDVLASPSG
jgi:two-component system cell cycle response regulator DivK